MLVFFDSESPPINPKTMGILTKVHDEKLRVKAPINTQINVRIVVCCR